MTIATTHDRPYARSTVKFVRMSASKVRIVLDLIRGDHVVDAIETLALSERKASHDIAKALRSAVANANHNEEIPTEELYVSACYADEGPTLKRFRPRARGRAGRVKKRTCHITVEVARMTDEEIARRSARLEAKGTAATPGADAGPPGGDDRRRPKPSSRPSTKLRPLRSTPAPALTSAAVNRARPPSPTWPSKRSTKPTSPRRVLRRSIPTPTVR